jgi:hypothetical protein
MAIDIEINTVISWIQDQVKIHFIIEDNKLNMLLFKE